jgi:hypothetical protein
MARRTPVASSRLVVSLLVGALLVALAGPTAAALPSPPLDFGVAAETAAPDGPITIRVAALPGRPWPPGMALDVYVLWATGERAAFLRPDGVWSPIPVPFRPAMDATSPPAVLVWRPLRRHAEIPLAMLAVPAGVDPLRRGGWTHRPMLRSIRVPVEGGVRRYDVTIIASLGAAAGLAILAVAVLRWAAPGRSAARGRGARVDDLVRQ